jgi:hypothetical protein
MVLAAFAIPSVANACMSDGPDGYSTGLVWQHPPKIVPDDAYVVKISKVRFEKDSWAFSAKIVEGPEAMVGRREYFVPLNLNSCVGFGERDGYGVVYAKPVETTISDEQVAAWQIIDYRPSAKNETLRRQPKAAQWQYPGSPAKKWTWPE